MGETRDHLVDPGQELGQEALDKSKQVVQHRGRQLKDEAKSTRGSPAGNLVEKVKTVAQEATNTAKEEVKKQAPALANAATDQGQGPKPGEAQGAQPTRLPLQVRVPSRRLRPGAGSLAARAQAAGDGQALGEVYGARACSAALRSVIFGAS